ncbi:MAG: hypothetical protein EBV86_00210 [Marivivens sp.]|nr:hypothetical protein [Marivivens sp.]
MRLFQDDDKCVLCDGAAAVQIFRTQLVALRSADQPNSDKRKRQAMLSVFGEIVTFCRQWLGQSLGRFVNRQTTSQHQPISHFFSNRLYRKISRMIRGCVDTPLQLIAHPLDHRSQDQGNKVLGDRLAF